MPPIKKILIYVAMYVINVIIGILVNLRLVFFTNFSNYTRAFSSFLDNEILEQVIFYIYILLLVPLLLYLVEVGFYKLFLQKKTK